VVVVLFCSQVLKAGYFQLVKIREKKEGNHKNKVMRNKNPQPLLK
jgi:hypothetical protein